jgi:SET domain-containing protein
MIDGERTYAGRYVNHSASPNAKAVVVDAGNVRLLATRDIDRDEEITTNYRDTLQVQGLKRIS